MTQKTIYTVVVGNIGQVLSTNIKTSAFLTFAEYAQMSERGIGRAAGEDVTILADDEISQEYHGYNSRNHSL